MGPCRIAGEPICGSHRIHRGKAIHGGLHKSIAQTGVGNRLCLVDRRTGISRYPISRKLAKCLATELWQALLENPSACCRRIGGRPCVENLPERGVSREGRVQSGCPLGSSSRVGFCPSFGGRLQETRISALCNGVRSKFRSANGIQFGPACHEVLLQLISLSRGRHSIHLPKTGLNLRKREARYFGGGIHGRGGLHRQGLATPRRFSGFGFSGGARK